MMEMERRVSWNQKGEVGGLGVGEGEREMRKESGVAKAPALAPVERGRNEVRNGGTGGEVERGESRLEGWGVEED